MSPILYPEFATVSKDAPKSFVILANAGIPWQTWGPAFAGVTRGGMQTNFGDGANDSVQTNFQAKIRLRGSE
jgi:hypothetical protein